MNDEEMRRRFRRDFTTEPIKPLRNQPQKPAPQAQQPRSQEIPPVTAGTVAAPTQPVVEKPQPTPQPAPDFTAPAPAAKKTKSKRRKRSKLLVIPVFIILLISLLYGGYYVYQQLSVPVPKATVKSVDFPILYPSKLPSGYSLKKDSFNTSSDVVIYEADSSNSKIIFTVQKRPPNFDFQTFYKQGLGGAASFNTSVGEAAIGKTEGRLLGSFVTDQTWLLISTTNDKVQSSDFRTILNGIKITGSN